MTTLDETRVDAAALERIVGEGNVLAAEPLSRHCTFRIGGPARLLARPQDERALAELVATLRESNEPYLVVGKGSNLLFPDDGYDGVIVEVGRAMGGIEIDGTTVRAEAGISLSALAKQAARAGLAGLEFASGIPGTLGGGLFMNAGAYGGQLSDVVVRARVLEADGTVRTVEVAEDDFGYRKSPIQAGGIVLSAEIELTPDDPDAIQGRMADLDERRRTKQPLEYPSAGSTFKRPPGHYASALVDEAGLKGWRAGGAAVSEKHAGFVVNLGDATCADVLAVIAHAQDVVRERFGVELEPEVRIVENPRASA